MIKIYESEFDVFFNNLFYWSDSNDEFLGVKFDNVENIPLGNYHKNMIAWDYNKSELTKSNIINIEFIVQYFYYILDFRLSLGNVFSQISISKDTDVLIYNSEQSNNIWKRVCDLQINDKLIAIPMRGNIYKNICNIQLVKRNTKFVKITTDGNNEYVSQGVWLKDV